MKSKQELNQLIGKKVEVTTKFDTVYIGKNMAYDYINNELVLNVSINERLELVGIYYEHIKEVEVLN